MAKLKSENRLPVAYFDPADVNYDTPKNYGDLSPGIDRSEWTVQAYVLNLTDEGTVTNFAQVFGTAGRLHAELLPNMPHIRTVGEHPVLIWVPVHWAGSSL